MAGAVLAGWRWRLPWALQAVLLAALVLALTVAYTGHLAGAERAHNRRLEAVNFLLEQQMQQRHRAEEALARNNRALTLVCECNQALVHAGDEHQLLQRICDLAVGVGGYALAWVGYADQEGANSVRPLAVAGAGNDSVHSAMATWADTECARDGAGGPSGTAIRSRVPTLCRDLLTDPTFSPWRERALAQHFRSCLALPLLANGGAMGALTLYATQPDAFDPSEISLLTELAGDLAFGIRALRTRAQHHHAAQQLRRASRYARSLIEASLDPLVTISPDGKIMDANQATELVTGMARERLIGSEFCHCFTEPERAHRAYAEALAGGVVRDYLLSIRHVSGQLTEVLYNASLLRDHQGAVLGVFAAARDVTARRHAERALEQYAAELRRSNAELQDFAYIASHDLQEPLRKIAAFGDRLREHSAAALDDTGRDYLERMLNASRRMAALIDGLLQYSRVSTHAQGLATVDLMQVAFEVIVDLEERIRACGARVQITTLPRLRADRTQMRQLLQNLLANALKFRRPDVVPQITVGWRDTEGGLEISVQDNGIGFEESYVARLFRPFQRLHGRSEFEGSGMGLAICRKIAERHGGSITAHSRPGEGSTFVVRLPPALHNDHGVTQTPKSTELEETAVHSARSA